VIYRVKDLVFEDGKMQGPEMDSTSRIIKVLKAEQFTITKWYITVLVESS
jgi:hypothetical protein